MHVLEELLNVVVERVVERLRPEIEALLDDRSSEVPPLSRRLRRVKEIVATSPFTEASLRSLIHDASRNGLDRCLIRNGRRLLIDENAFSAWLEDQRASQRRLRPHRRSG